jgi:DNA excision repair protein ERCC-2
VKPELPEALLPLLRGFMDAAERWLTTGTRTAYRAVLLEFYFRAGAFLRVADAYDGDYVTCLETAGGDLCVKLFCVDPSRQLGAALQRGRSAVFFSATLTPPHYYQSLFGSRSTIGQLRVPAPFPRENLCVVLTRRISTRYGDRDRTKAAVSRVILRLLAHRKGNYLIFFPSYAYLQMVQDLLAREQGDWTLMAQTPGMSEADRDAFLGRFARKRPDTLAALVVMGGIFGEGIDLVGEHLTGAAIVGVGLPAVCAEREQIRHYFESRQKAGFDYAYRYPGMTRVLQAAGRVIRSESDRGVVLLVDERFAGPGYRGLLPPHWRPIAADREGMVSETLARFWARA